MHETRAPDAPVAPEIEARVQEIIRRSYRKVISGNADEGFLIEVPDLPGCMTAGETEAEAIEMLPEAMMVWLESMLLEGLPFPEPTAEHQYNGKLLVRMPKTMHRRLIERAQDEGISVN